MKKFIVLMLILLSSISMYSRDMISKIYPYVALTDNNEEVFNKKHTSKIVIGKNTVYINTFGIDYVFKILDIRSENFKNEEELILITLNEECILILKTKDPYDTILIMPNDIMYIFYEHGNNLYK